MAHLNMGLVLAQLGRKQEAIQAYKHCASLDGTRLKDIRLHESTKISALFNLGRIYADDGHYDQALDVYMEAVSKMPNHYQPQSLFNMIGEAYAKTSQFKEAEYWFKKSLAAKPDHIPAHLTYAKLLAKANRTHEAELLFLKAKHLDPNDSSVYQHYGIIAMILSVRLFSLTCISGQFLSEQNRPEDAVQIYLSGVRKAPNEYEIVFNTANSLRQARHGTHCPPD